MLEEHSSLLAEPNALQHPYKYLALQAEIDTMQALSPVGWAKFRFLLGAVKQSWQRRQALNRRRQIESTTLSSFGFGSALSDIVKNVI